ncbi:MAG: hypothetical protein NTX50_02245 [Candidatus Sumerlaeota bacterium]|nr:hypothetical protein [Candidatus Sumerlaeota bacterium]
MGGISIDCAAEAPAKDETPRSDAARIYARKGTWPETMLALRAVFLQQNDRSKSSFLWRARDPRDPLTHELERLIENDFPVEYDWMLQDYEKGLRGWLVADAAAGADIEKAMIRRALDELGQQGNDLRAEYERLAKANAGPDDRRLLDLYAKVCEQRRAIRLQPVLRQCPKIIFTKHATLGGSHYAYTEAQSDAQAERHFLPGAALCLLELQALAPGQSGGEKINGAIRARITDLLSAPNGMIRDPDVSFDGTRILFAWKKSDREDDFHLYEMDARTRAIRQLTQGLGFADYEGAYLSNGDILFNSTRCVQTVDCFWTEVSNLYACDKNGKFLRRLTFDQVHDNYPTVTEDGRVLYTRWEYNDRGQIYPQPLYQMNTDGTAQTEFYGNNSWFPTTILHARGIPGTQKVLAIATGHHSRQTGKLIVVDPAKGRQENSGVQLVAPVRKTDAVKVDAYGQDGELFQYPYPLSETEFLVTYDPYGWPGRPRLGEAAPLFAIYFMTIDGRRELLASDPKISCNQPVPLAPRRIPHSRPSLVDYRKDAGIYYMQNIYQGPGLEGVARGSIKKLRVVTIDFRAAGIQCNNSRGPAGGALACTPVSIGNGCWDPKTILGEATVHEDGSACFTVPARTPVYFQAVDGKGRVAQTMRSWSTLQPGESFSCVGCHENKNEAPWGYARTTLAMKAGPQPLAPFYGAARGFSFIKEIQPILDRHCIRCHNDPNQLAARKSGGKSEIADKGKPRDKAFSLLGAWNFKDDAGRKWSDAYLALTQCNVNDKKFLGNPDGKLVNWVSAQSAPPMLSPYSVGAAKSALIPMLEAGHNGVKLSREEMDKFACWIDLAVPFCGDYLEANAWSENEIQKYDHYLQKRKAMEQIERKNIEALITENGNLSPSAQGSSSASNSAGLSDASDRSDRSDASDDRSNVSDSPSASKSRRSNHGTKTGFNSDH